MLLSHILLKSLIPETMSRKMSKMMTRKCLFFILKARMTAVVLPSAIKKNLYILRYVQ